MIKVCVNGAEQRVLPDFWGENAVVLDRRVCESSRVQNDDKACLVR
jgi:hypothetical protein